jgi:P-type E1-E2 ATPase
MLKISIPGRDKLVLKHIVLDFNGTMALEGKLIPGVGERLNKLSEAMQVHVITADTFGTVKDACRNINCTVQVLAEEPGSREKLKFISRLGAEHCVTVGNGVNDVLMLEGSALGIVILGPEGTAIKALLAADVAAGDILEGLDMLLNPGRLVATLRT